MKTINKLLIAAIMVLMSFPTMAQDFVGTYHIDGRLAVGNSIDGSELASGTIFIKEDNITVRFSDASTLAGYPTNDWEIEINSGGTSGTDHFAINDVDGATNPFRIEAGARTNALYVEADGDIGIGTDNPAVDLHVKIGDTPALRLEQDNTSGWAPQTWDLAGNETNFFLRDVTNGSKLPLRVRPNAPTSSLDLRSDRIELNGNAEDLDLRISGDVEVNLFYTDASESMIGIGTDAPTSLLDINGETFRLRGITNTGSNADDDGVPDVGKVLVSTDALGTARWEVNPLQEEFDLLTARVEALEIAVTNCCGTFVNETDGSNAAQLFQNYPNPFDESTIIEYYIPYSYSNAYLDIFDVNGTFVTRFNLKPGGQGYVVIGANSLAVGNYVYSLFADDQLIGSKQMVISN